MFNKPIELHIATIALLIVDYVSVSHSRAPKWSASVQYLLYVRHFVCLSALYESFKYCIVSENLIKNAIFFCYQCVADIKRISLIPNIMIFANAN